MLSIPGYTITEQVSSSIHARVYRGVYLQNNKKVLVKLPSKQPSNHEIASLQHEYDLLTQLQSPGLIKAYDLIEWNSLPALILEDVGGISLEKYLGKHPISIDDFLKIALQLVDIVIVLYQHRVIHKDIKPANIIIKPENLGITLIDFSISSQIIKESPALINLGLLEGTLAYMSPEQTGRINRPVDYRTDFYSLGVTFFEMLTGVLPFPSKDPSELVYSHIAKVPPTVCDINSNVPQILSAIVSKLMSKEPEKRYKHALHLKTDLEECAQQWHSNRKINDFQLGKNDIQDQLQLSNKLYGREKQVAALLEHFERVSKGVSSLMLICGYSGIGKTSLVNEVHKPITQLRGYFITGKFDQMKRTTPYSAIVMAFDDLIKQVLAEPEEKLNALKQQLLTAVGNNGQILINVIPEVELIIGKQPAVPFLPPRDSQNRFTFVFQSFVQVFAQKSHPLVIFLDDLQWADSASLRFIESLLLDIDSHHVFILGAYRDNEVYAAHPLLQSINTLEVNGADISKLELLPLQEIDIENMLQDVFKYTVPDIPPLAKLFLDKTQGNPFFINQFLKALYDIRLIQFSYTQNKWCWDITSIVDQNITDNVVDLLVAKIRHLPNDVQRTLSLAACLGQRFSLQSLATISGQNLTNTAKHVYDIIQADIIFPLEEGYRTQILTKNALYPSAFAKKENLNYCFVHDRIQQASYRLIEKKDLQSVNLKIVRLLLKDQPLQENDERLFFVLDHLDQCLRLVEDYNEKQEYANYYYFAGVRAQIAIAYDAAIYYFETACNLLAEDAWDSNYDLMLNIHKHYVECLYTVGDFKNADQFFTMMVQQAKTNVEKAQLHLIQIKAYGHVSMHREACKTSFRALSLLGFHVPKHANKLHVLKEVVLIHYRLGRRDIKELYKEMVVARDDKTITQIKLLNAIIPSVFLLNDLNMYGYVNCKLINMSLTVGYTEEMSTAYFAYGVFLLAKLNKIPLAADFIALANKLENLAYSAEVTMRNQTLQAIFVKHWYQRLASSVPYMQECFHKCIENGNLEYAVYSLTVDIVLYHVGMSLTELSQKLIESIEFSKRSKNADWERHFVFKLKMLQYLQGQVIPLTDFAKLQEEMLNGTRALRVGSDRDYCEFLYLLGIEIPLALENAEKFYKDKYALMGHIASAFGILFYALSAAKVYHIVTRKQQRYYWKLILKVQKQLKYWATHCPNNYQFMYLWLSAEIARLRDQPSQAAALYDEALEITNTQGFINYTAMINECTARFYLALKRQTCAIPYLQNAYYSYQRWGAIHKCALLQNEFSALFNISLNNTQGSFDSTISTNQQSSQILDFKSILNSSQDLSSEIHLAKLVNKLLKIILKNAGAQRVVLLFEQQDQLLVISEMKSEGDTTFNEKQGIPLETYTNLPKSIIYYVKRTHESLLLDNVIAIERFQKDPYFQTHNSKSIFCFPIAQHGHVPSYVYLENYLTSHAFTEDRLTVLRLLAGQASTSLENAKIYEAINRFVPYELLRQINRENILEVQLGDQIQQEMTVLFSDIRSFTTYSEQWKPDEVYYFINQFLGYMEPIISKNHGFVDKYVGDAIMALFINPDDAVQASLNMLDALKDFNKEQEKHGFPSIRIGIGINTGELMLGIIGNKTRMEGSVLGDAVNIASRIEDLTKQYKTDILISDATKVRLTSKAFQLSPLGEIEIRGKQQMVTIWCINSFDELK